MKPPILRLSGQDDIKKTLKKIYLGITSPSATAAENWKSQLEYVTAISDNLFDKLHTRLSSCNDVHDILSNDVDVEALLLLLRCCLVITSYCDFDDVLMDKLFEALALRSRLGLHLPDRRPRDLFGYDDVRADVLKSCQCDVCKDVLKRLLEVILDEMFGNERFWEHSATAHSLTFAEGDKSVTHSENMLDFITSYFSLTFSGEQSLGPFIECLVWTGEQTTSRIELSLTKAVSILKSPVMSASKLMQAHLVSLVSGVIGINVSSIVGSHTHSYISAFLESVIMYGKHMPKFLMGLAGSSTYQKENILRDLECQYRFGIYDRIDAMLVGCDRVWSTDISYCKPMLKGDLLSYLKVNMYVFEESVREEAFSFLSTFMTTVVSIEADETLCHKTKQIAVQDLCLLGAILKLMSCALLQTVSCLKKRSSGLKLSSEILSLVAHMSCFGQYEFYLSYEVQQLIVDALKSHSLVYNDSNMILVHFAKLLYVSVASGVVFLVKGCLFMLMVCLSAIKFEESLNFGRSSPPVVASSPTIATSTAAQKVASVFQRRRQEMLRCSNLNDDYTTGEEFLQYFLDEGDDLSEFSNFIVCKKGKDYGSWLGKMAECKRRRYLISGVRRWHRKRKAFYHGKRNKIKESPKITRYRSSVSFAILKSLKRL